MQLVVFLSLFLAIACIENKRTIVESDHYYSDSQIATTYNIGNVVQNKPLILLLKTKEVTLKNPVNFTITSGTNQVVCRFTIPTNLCVMTNVPQSAVSLRIECQTLPCETSWIIYQPQIKVGTKVQTSGGLIETPATENHLFAMVTCNDPKLTPNFQEVKVYSTSPYLRTEANVTSTVYFLFTVQEKGYVYVDVGNSWTSCLQIMHFSVEASIDIANVVTVRDFSAKGSPAMYALKTTPKGDFGFAGVFHPLSNNLNITVKLTAERNKKVQTVFQRAIVQEKMTNPTYALSFNFKPLTAQYTNIELQIDNEQPQPCLFTLDLHEAERQEVNLRQTLYFNLHKDQKLAYRVRAIEGAKNTQRVHLMASKDLSLSKSFCEANAACDFEVKAVADANGTVSVGDKNNQFVEIEKKVTRRISQGDNLYFKYRLVKGKEIQAVVNSPNVIVYAAEEKKCAAPNKECREKTMNMHHPFVYEPDQDGVLLFNVEGLDSAQFTLTLIQAGDQYVQLQDNEPFSYAMDQEEESLSFKFTIAKKIETSFNLITVPNTLDLLVRNGNSAPQNEDFVSEGNVVFRQKEIKGLTFIVQVRKAEVSKGKVAQFTIIASTKGSVMRLEPSVTHYQTLSPNMGKTYVFEYKKADKYIINFYSYNLKERDIKIALMVSKDNTYKQNTTEKLIIDQTSDVMDVSEVSKKVCAEEQICEVFLRILNTMEFQITMALTLLVQDAVIELKDGKWQSFGSNEIAKSLRFYFHPQHADRDIMLFYKPMNPKSYLTYNIWKADSSTLNPTEWPFPQNSTVNKASSTLVIGREAIKKLCWPYCVILISIFGQPQDSFLIMLSNSQMELPEKTRLDLALQLNQISTLIVNLKYAMDKQTIHIYTTTTIGFSVIRANVISSRNLRCSNEEEYSDFILANSQNNIAVSQIKQIIEREDMTEDGSISLCISIKAITSTKVSVEYTLDEDQAKTIEFNTFQSINIVKGEKKLYKVPGSFEFTVKVMRVSGYPSILVEKCAANEEIEDCTQRVKDDPSMGKQIVAKTEQFKEAACRDCFFIFKVQAEEQSNFTLHLQSMFSELSLRENILLTDFTNEGQSNQYEIAAIKNEEIIINLQVTQGEVTMRVYNFNGLNIEKSSNQLIHIVVPTTDNMEKQSNLGKVQTLSTTSPVTFIYLSVKSKDNKKASSYIISYSSGARELYLQDGVVTDYQLDAGKSTFFYYRNDKESDHVYLLVAMNDSAALKALSLHAYSLSNAQDLTSKTEFTLAKPTLKKNVQTPSYLFLLPKQSNYLFQLKSPQTQQVTLNINHQQVIFLPYDHDFPFTLHPHENINVLIDVNIVGYVTITLKKCDRGEINFSYTFDYDAFVKEQYSYTTSLDIDPYYTYVLKANKIGTLYVKFEATDQNVLLSVQSSFSTTKQQKSTPKPGQKGVLNYQLSSNNQAIISFSKVVCQSEKCKEEFKYYILTADNQQNLYTQLVCPSNYFSLAGVSLDALAAKQIRISRTKDDVISFPYDLIDRISYVGVKAVGKDGTQIFYRPTEISTIWGQISRSGSKHLVSIILAFVLLTACVLILARRHARSGYRPIQDSD